MIRSDMKNHKGLHIEGDMAEVSAECILIMRAIYQRNKEVMGETIAQGILTNMLVKSIVEDVKKEDKILWETSDKQIEEYYD